MTDTPEISAKKQALRSELLGRRASVQLSPKPLILNMYMEALRRPPGSVVACIWPIRGEADMRPLCHMLRDEGYRVCLPFTPARGNALSFHVWTPSSRMMEGRFGTQYPDGSQIIPNIIFVPLLGFDREGFRIGYGGGYYDRTLAALPDAEAIGFAFAMQEVQTIPTGPYDVPLRTIVTDHGVVLGARTVHGG